MQATIINITHRNEPLAVLTVVDDGRRWRLLDRGERSPSDIDREIASWLAQEGLSIPPPIRAASVTDNDVGASRALYVPMLAARLRDPGFMRSLVTGAASGDDA